MHEDAHLSYKRYKVDKLCFKGHPRYTSTRIHIHILFFIFQISPPFLLKNNKQNKHTKKHIKKKKTRLTRKLPTKHTRDARKRMELLKGVFFLPNKRLGRR